MADDDKPKPFVSKLWRMVNDPANEDYIRWMPGGQSIQIVDRSELEKKVLPQYFKHARFTSFVRQLNMYGWHKVQDYSGANGAAPSDENWQFKNPDFIRDREDLLVNIKRHKSAGGANGALVKREPGSDDDDDLPAHNHTTSSGDSHMLQRVLKELEQIRTKQITIGEDLGRMRRDNEMLWSEYYRTRERYDKHSQMLSRILRFLAGVTAGSNQIGNGQMGGQFTPMANHVGLNTPGGSAYPGSRQALPATSPPAIQELQELQEMQDSDPNNGATPRISRVSPTSSGTTPLDTTGEPSQSGPHLNGSQALVPRGRPLLSSTDTGKQLVRRGVTPENMDTVAQLFPELLDASSGSTPGVTSGSLTQPAPPLSQDELDNLAREINSQGDTLHSIKDWLVRNPPARAPLPVEDTDFNVDDFLVDSLPFSDDSSGVPGLEQFRRQRGSVAPVPEDPGHMSQAHDPGTGDEEPIRKRAKLA